MVLSGVRDGAGGGVWAVFGMGCGAGALTDGVAGRWSLLCYIRSPAHDTLFPFLLSLSFVLGWEQNGQACFRCFGA